TRWSICSDVAPGGPISLAVERPGRAALVPRKAGVGAAGIDRRAGKAWEQTHQQSMREGGTAVVLQGAQPWVTTRDVPDAADGDAPSGFGRVAADGTMVQRQGTITITSFIACASGVLATQLLLGSRRHVRAVVPPPYAGSSTTGKLVTPRKTMLGGIGSGASATRRKRRVRASSTRSATSASSVASDAPRQ